MTIGELSRMFCEELKLDLDLQVVPCEGWNRSDYWDRSGLLWVNPSPNMRSLNQAILYPGIGILETTNLSVGRGTDTPFELVGSPWIDARELAMKMNNLQLPGVAFIPVEFTPTTSKFVGELCRGINIEVTDRKVLRPVELGLALAAMLRREYPDDWETKDLNRLLGNDSTYRFLMEGMSGEELNPALTEGVNEFLLRRQVYLIYPELGHNE